MNFFEEQRREAVARANRELLMIAWAESIIGKLGLQDVLPHVTNVILWEDYDIKGRTGHPDWEDYARVPNGYYRLSLYIPMAAKECVRPYLLHLEWRKHNHVTTHTNLDSTPYFLENWRWEENPKSWKTHVVCVSFYRPVEVGESVNSNGCKVKRVTKEYSDLVLACEV